MNPDLALALDIVGTIVFALSGALIAVRKELDIVGIVVLSVAAGLGGGMVRDITLGTTPPAAMEGWLYLMLAVSAGVVGGYFHPLMTRLNVGIRVLDALGLGVFAVAGSLKSLDAGLNPVPAVLLGVVTGVGGGVIRDVLAGDIPLVLRRDIYALAALFGAVACVVSIEVGLSEGVATVAGIGGTLLLRLLAIRFDWHAPRVPPRA